MGVRPKTLLTTTAARCGVACVVAVVAVFSFVGVGCGPSTAEARPPVSLSLQIGTRQSCGVFSGLDYDTSCLAAVYVAVREPVTRQIVTEKCTTLSPRKAELGEILRGEAVVDFSGISTTGSFVFEVRGLHDKGAAAGVDRCADADNDNHWLFWGESDVVDLAAFNDKGGSLLVPIVVDCRDCAFSCPAGDCFGCQALDTPACSADLPESFCVPGVAFQCDKRCDVDDDCFEGARACLPSGFCDTRDPSGGLCSPCALIDGVVDGCGDGFTCVGPPGATQGFCASSCPQSFCVQGTRCNRRNNNLFVIGS